MMQLNQLNHCVVVYKQSWGCYNALLWYQKLFVESISGPFINSGTEDEMYTKANHNLHQFDSQQWRDD